MDRNSACERDWRAQPEPFFPQEMLELRGCSQWGKGTLRKVRTIAVGVLNCTIPSYPCSNTLPLSSMGQDLLTNRTGGGEIVGPFWLVCWCGEVCVGRAPCDEAFVPWFNAFGIVGRIFLMSEGARKMAVLRKMVKLPWCVYNHRCSFGIGLCLEGFPFEGLTFFTINEHILIGKTGVTSLRRNCRTRQLSIPAILVGVGRVSFTDCLCRNTLKPTVDE